MAIATLTSKGRITIPLEIRKQLQLRPGHRIEFHLDRVGRLILAPLIHHVRELKGSVRSPHKKPVSLKEMERAIGRGYAGML